MSESLPSLAVGWRRRFWRQRRVRWIARWFGALVMLALLAGALATDRPWYCTYEGETYWPLFQGERMFPVSQSGGQSLAMPLSLVDWEALRPQLAGAWWAPIPYGLQEWPSHRRLSPLGPQLVDGQALPWRFRHWLGTDHKGRDVLALLLHGIRISLGVALLAMMIAATLGFVVGSMAGFFGDDGLLLALGVRWTLLPALGLGLWYGFGRRSVLFSGAGGGQWWWTFFGGILWMLAVVAAMLLVAGWLSRRIGKLRLRPLRVDFWISRGIEVLDSLPQLLLIVALGAVLARDVWTMMALIGLTGWSGVARLVRAETYRIREADYLTAARGFGFSRSWLLRRQVWPEVLPMLLVPLSFGVGNAIVAESALSFLGLIRGSASWGSVLALANLHRDLWWLMVFPGLAIFTTVLLLNILGESLRKALQPQG